jgi:hypothetical protein
MLFQAIFGHSRKWAEQRTHRNPQGPNQPPTSQQDFVVITWLSKLPSNRKVRDYNAMKYKMYKPSIQFYMLTHLWLSLSLDDDALRIDTLYKSSM